MKLSVVALLCGSVVAHAATLTQRDPPTPALDKRASTCTPKAGGSNSTDDVPAIESAIASCSSGTIVIPSSTTYYINSAFTSAGCSGCTLQVEGTLKVASSTSYWEGRRAIFLMDSITGATVKSTTGAGVIDGNGQDAWDLFASNSSYKRPTLFYITNSKNVVIQNLKFKNAPKNTDGWDIGTSTCVSINGASVTNDDDCVTFKPGCNYATLTDITCIGSHGLSVGSLGSGSGSTDTVKNVLVIGATMINSTKAASIKLYPAGPSHGTAVVSNVTFENVVVNSDYAFQFQSCYGEDASYCSEYPSTATLTGVVVKDFSGTTSSRYKTDVANLDRPAAGTCGVTLSGMTVKPASGSVVYLCANTPSSLGVTCTSGASG